MYVGELFGCCIVVCWVLGGRWVVVSFGLGLFCKKLIFIKMIMVVLLRWVDVIVCIEFLCLFFSREGE